jgi:hypothetical protein
MSGPPETVRALAPATAVGSNAAASVFPQRFTPFEYYFWLEHLPEYPQLFYIRLDCRGPFDREAFVKAYELAHQRHPFLSARIEYDRRGWPHWTAGTPVPIVWGDQLSWRQAGLTNTDNSPRALARVVQNGDDTTLSFAFDHIAVDGMGGFQFITDLMVAYAHLCSGEAGVPAWRRVDAQLLGQRGRHTLLGRNFRPVDLWRLPQSAVPLMVRRAAVLSDRGEQAATSDSVEHEVSVGSEFLVHTLSEEETAALADVARDLEVRLHELMLRDYYLMLAAWNEGTPEARLPLRVLVPINMRRKQDYRMPAANMFGFAFTTRRMRDCRCRVALLESICREMATIKSTRWPLYHELGVRLFSLCPPLLRYSVRRKWTFATAVFTNLNAGFDHVPLPWRDDRRLAGELVVENGYGAGPIRPDTRLSLAIHNYAGRLSIALTCDRSVFGPAQQQALLQAYLVQLRRTAETAT